MTASIQPSFPMFQRDYSWLSFNYRVLQEAINEDVPLFERLKFLAIYSSNLDEFYRVRVAGYRYLIKYFNKIDQLQKKTDTEKELKKINQIVDKQQQKFGFIFNQIIIPKLKEIGTFVIKDKSNINEIQDSFLTSYFSENVRKHLTLIELKKKMVPPFLENRMQYLVIQTKNKEWRLRYYLLNLPTEKVNRFVEIPDRERQIIIQLADIIRMHLAELIPDESILHSFAVKNSRDAELYLDDTLGDTIVDKIKRSIDKREIGEVTRFLYDEKMPKEVLSFVRKSLSLKKIHMVPGGRYHNFHDFFSFPFPSIPHLSYPTFKKLKHPSFVHEDSFFEWITKEDRLLHFPYQDYDQVIEFLEEASKDKMVTSIKITLYRVASDSKVCKALIKAAKNGKEVIVFNEVKARFDEETNMYWGDELKKAGAKVIYSFEKLKVHSKICLVTRKENQTEANYAYLGTGNFNEKTANIYCDHALLTKDILIADELSSVFKYLEDNTYKPTFSKLLVAPFNMRSEFLNLIDFEIAQAKKGKIAEMILKMNSLEDPEMIQKIYEASNAGVKIKIIVRGICCLIPGVEGMSKNCKVSSIVDRYLEHGRMYYFHHNGENRLYLASADWMKRNLSSRVEVAFPILNLNLKAELIKMLHLQLKDNTKARVLNKTQSNPYKKSKSVKKVRAQFDTYEYLKSLKL